MPKKTQKSTRPVDSATGDGDSAARRPPRPIRRPHRYLHSRESSPVASTSTAMMPGDGDLGSILSSLQSMQARMARLEQRETRPPPAAHMPPADGTVPMQQSGDNATSGDEDEVYDAPSTIASVPERESRPRKKAAHGRHNSRGDYPHNNAKRHRDGKRRQNSPAPSASTSGEDSSSSDYDSSDTDFEDYDRPQSSFGQVTGSTVTEKLRTKILTNKFIEMAELLPNFKSAKSEECSVHTSKDNTLRFLRTRPKCELKFGTWCDAFKIYTAIYMEKGKTRRSVLKLARSLLTYSSTITSLQRRNYDWAAYDRHFRSDRELSRESWATTRHDLLMLYRQEPHPFRSSRDTAPKPDRKPSGSNFRPGRSGTASKGGKHNTTKDGHSLPFGYCIAYHTRGQRCETPDCTYLHQSPCCEGKHGRHPVYAPCPSNTNQGSVARQRQPPNTFTKPTAAATSQH